MLLGAAAVIALMGDGRHDRRLAVGPPAQGNAGAFAQARPRAVGGDEELHRADRTVAERDRYTFAHDGKVRHRLGDDGHAFRDRLGGELADEAGVLDHVGEGLARLDVALEAQEHRPYRVLDAAVGDDHVADLLRPRRDRVPHAERLEHAPRRRRDRRGARIVAAPELGIGDRHGEIRPEPLA